MSHQRTRRASVAPIAALLLLAGAIPAAAEIQVAVNGTPVQFGGTKPMEIGGRVLIPLRAVVESLGAEVKWDAATQTVRGRKGERTFELRIGSRDAIVGGASKTLDVPAQLVSGATMVPLRFVAEALGAEVGWNARSQQVQITAAAETAPDPSRVAGEVVLVRLNDRPATVTIKVDGINTTYALSQDTIVLRGKEGERGAPIDVDQLRAGDKVRIRLAADRSTAEVIEATLGAVTPVPGGRVTGEVVAVQSTGIRKTITVKTANGNEVFDIEEDAILSRATTGGQQGRVGLNALRIGDRVSLRTDRTGRLISALEATAAAPTAIPVVGGRVNGEVVAVSANGRRITVRSGNAESTYDIPANAAILRGSATARPTAAAATDIRVGDTVRIDVDAAGKLAEEITARATANSVEPDGGVPDAAVRITEFRHNASAFLREGSVLRATLVGTPRGTATFDVGSIARDVAMTESAQRPGEYVGTLTIPTGKTAKKVPVIGQLKVGNRVGPLIQAGDLVEIDSVAPTITEMAPANGVTVSSQEPEIYAEISDGSGSGIDPASVKLVIGGRTVTTGVRVTNRFIIYTPTAPLPAGRTTVQLQVSDKAGNREDVSWVFTTQRAVAALTSVTHNGDKALRAGDVLTVTAKGAPGSKASFSVGDTLTNLAMREVKAGEYVGEYTVRQGTQLPKAPVSVTLTPPGGVAAKLQATAPVNLLTQAPKAPVIRMPAGEIELGEELIVRGTGVAGSKVVVEVNFEGKAFGALPVSGTFGSQEVTVGPGGNWRTEPFAARLPLGVKRPTLTITAVATDSAGEKSPVATQTVKTK